MTPSTLSSTSSGKRCTTARPPNWRGGGRRNFSGSIWGDGDLVCRPGKRRDPYAADYRLRKTVRRLLVPRTPAVMGPGPEAGTTLLLEHARQPASLTPSHHGHVPGI